MVPPKDAFKKNSGNSFLFGCFRLLGLGFFLSFLTGPVTGASFPRIRTEIAFPGLRFENPLFLTGIPDHSGRLCVVEQAGRIHFFANESNIQETQVVLDMTGRVSTRNMEEGLLGLAFAPDLDKHPFVFLYYSKASPRRSVLSRFRLSEDLKNINPQSERIILEISEPYGNHNGGMIGFGPGGYLFVSVGDGGGAGDPHGHAQRLDTLLGKILRLDVLHEQEEKYLIPESNPFVKDPAARGEIWALGLRNVWRFSFDWQTGDLWAGDVGQNRFEEIDLIHGGGNYGWNLREGFHAYNKGADRKDFQPPLVEHNRREARSITGGYVYRGSRMPDLQGYYCYGDFVTGRTWFLKVVKGKILDQRSGPLVPAISSFGLDANKEIYMCSFDGRIYTLIQG